MKRRRQIQTIQRLAAVRPGTFDGDARTVEAVLSTGARVLRVPWFDDPFYEELAIDADSVRLERLNSGAQVLNNHRQDGLEDILGVIERAWIESGEVLIRIRFGERDEIQGFVRDVGNGTIRNLSTAYRVYEFEQDPERLQDGLPIFRATDWEPFEASFVTVPADPGAQVRSGVSGDEETYPCTFAGVETMAATKKKASRRAAGTASETKPATTPAEETRADETEEQPETEAEEPETPEPQERGSEQTGEVDDPADVQQSQERARSVAILGMCRQLGADGIDLAHELIEGKATMAQARKRVQSELEGRETPIASTRVTREEGDSICEGIRLGMYHRCRMSIDGKPVQVTDQVRRYAGMSLLRIGEEFLRLGGESTSYGKGELAERALRYVATRTSGHATSDFPSLLEDMVNKSLLDQYAMHPETYSQWASRRDLPDFKQASATRLHEGTALQAVPEDGTVKYAEFVDSGEKWGLVEYALLVALTRKALINDDLDAFTRIPQNFVRQARRLESTVVWNLIKANPVMEDGNPLFDAAHGNTQGTTALDVDGLGIARQLMFKQTDKQGNFIQPVGRHLRVPPELETKAAKLLADITPNTIDESNVWRSSISTMFAEPRLTDASQWYMFADGGDTPTVEYGLLSGEMGPRITTQPGWTHTGLEYRVQHDFGAGAVDWRGAVLLDES